MSALQSTLQCTAVPQSSLEDSKSQLIWICLIACTFLFSSPGAPTYCGTLILLHQDMIAIISQYDAEYSLPDAASLLKMSMRISPTQEAP